MNIGIKGNWCRYSRDGDWQLSSIKDCGKWVYTFSNQKQAQTIIDLGIASNSITYAKHTLGNGGALCLYAAGTCVEEQKKIIKFMLENKLIKLTDDLNYCDMAFKFNGQSWTKEFGNNFDGLIRLSDFIDLKTGQFHEYEQPVINLYFKQIKRSKRLENIYQLKTLISAIDKYAANKINNIFKYNSTEIDFNHKIIHLVPFTYNLAKLYKANKYEHFLSICFFAIYYFVQNANSKQKHCIAQIENRNNTEIIQLLESINAPLSMTKRDINSFVTKFIIIYNNASQSEEFINCLGYLIFQGLFSIKPEMLDNIYERSLSNLNNN